MVLGKKVAVFDWEWGRNLAPRVEMGRKGPGENKKRSALVHELLRYN